MSDSNSSAKVNDIVVLGGGSAGFLAAFAIKKHLPDIALKVVRSTKMGVIGVGEGTIWSVVNFLHRFLELDQTRFHRACKPGIKLGIHYLWGPRPFFNYTFAPQVTAPLQGVELPRGYFCRESFDYADMSSVMMAHDKVCPRAPNGEPQLRNSYAYHLENQLFVSYLEELAVELGIETVDDIVSGVEQDATGVKALKLESGSTVRAGFFVDCSGFRAELIDKALGEKLVDFSDTLFCDSAIFGGWERTAEDVYHPYTTAETMDSGWSWKIEHDHLVNRGYVYSSAFVSDDAADAEFRGKNPLIKNTNVIKFRPGMRPVTWKKNVVAIGNSAGFVEPLEATAIGVICDATLNFVRALKSTGGCNRPAVREAYNRTQSQNWTIIRDFLAVHYRFNTRLKTPFWEACINHTPLGGAQKYIDLYREVGPDFSMIRAELERDFFGAEGYLSMLVGQNVPYQRDVEISARDKHAWKIYKDSLYEARYNAMDMSEYTAFVRGQGIDNRQPGGVDWQSGNIGELRWH